MLSKRLPDPFVARLDEVKSLRKVTDAELADIIGLPNRQYLSKIRRGEKMIPIEVKIQTWNLLDLPWNSESMMDMLPIRFRERLKAAGEKRPVKGG